VAAEEDRGNCCWVGVGCGVVEEVGRARLEGRESRYWWLPSCWLTEAIRQDGKE